MQTTRKKFSRAKIKDVKDISQREYFKNFDTGDEVAGKLGCELGSFSPDWRLHFHHYFCITVPYEVMRELALTLGYKWVDKRVGGLKCKRRETSLSIS